MKNQFNLKVEHHHYINNCMGAFYRGLLNYFSTELYPFRYRVISTYAKAVEFFNKHIQEGQEVDVQILPAMTLDPSGDFLPEERSGRFMWQYPNLYPSFGAKLFDPIYKDEQILITPVFTYFTGSFDLICWLNSVYEYIDFRTLVIMWSGGVGRVIRPAHLWSYIVLPDEILDYEYKNDTPIGERPYKVDWRSTKAALTLIKNMNQEKVVYPVLLSPSLVIESITDASEKYGATDNLASYKLQINIKYEIALPTFIHAKSDWKGGGPIKIAVSLGNVHSAYSTPTPKEIIEELIQTGPEYQDLKSLDIYRANPQEAYDATKIVEGDNITSYPSPIDICKWNAIVTGRMCCINTEDDWNNVQPGDIIKAYVFSQQYLPQMRLASGFICGPENLNTFLKSKVVFMEKPAIMNLNSTQFSDLDQYCGQVITLDPYLKKIYLGTVSSEWVDPSEPGWGSDTARSILDSMGDEGKSIINKHGAAYQFADGPPRDSTSAVTFVSDSILDFQAYYEFSEEDLQLPPGEDVHFNLPQIVNNPDRLILVSYPGQLLYNVHYTIDFVNQIVLLKIPAKDCEGVEMYFYK